MRIKILNKTEFDLPKYETEGSSGMDLRANLKSKTTKIDIFPKEDMTLCTILLPRKQVLVPTGIFIQLPDPTMDTFTGEGCSYEAQIRPRSGLAAKHGITIVNSPGTIDSDFRGEIKVILMNLTDHNVTINHGDRIAQMVIAKCEKIVLDEVWKLGKTERGEGGFGSSGTK